MKKLLVPLLILMFAAGFLVRLYRFDYPVADWHSFRQSDTNAVSVLYARDGINLLQPKYFDISHVQSGKDNPQGYRMVEFPVYNALQAGLFYVLKFHYPPGLGFSLVEVGRLISILASLAGAYLVFLLTKKYSSTTAGFFAAFFYLFLPFSIFYGRTILPDPAMAASILAGIYFFDRWISKKSIQYPVLSIEFIAAVFFTALALLLKPYALFFTLPMIWLAWDKFGQKSFKQWRLYLFVALSLAPLILWRVWISQFPEGIPNSTWLLNENGIRFRPAFFKWIFYERITKLILGYVGVLFLVLGSWVLVKKKNGFFLSFITSCAVYVVVIATGNVQHDYYQILIIPTLSMICGIGLSHLIALCKKNNFLKLQVVILAVFTVFAGWLFVKDYFNINDWNMVAAAEEANRVLPANSVVIAPYDGSTAFLNLIKRPGWPVFQDKIENLIKKGATHLVIASPTQSDFNGFGTKYEPVASSSSYLILKLK